MKKTKISKPLKSVRTPVHSVTDSLSVRPAGQAPSLLSKMLAIPKISPLSYIIGGIVVVVIIAAVFFKSLFVVALVNGQPVSRLELIRELERLAGKQALNSIVTRVLIEQEASKKQVSVSNKEISDAITKLTNDLKKQGQDINKLLAAQGMTMSSLTEQLRVQKLVEKIFAGQLKVTDKEVADYVEKNKAQLPTNQDPATLKESVVQQIKQQKLSDLFQTWLTTAQKNAKINYFLSF